MTQVGLVSESLVLLSPCTFHSTKLKVMTLPTAAAQTPPVVLVTVTLPLPVPPAAKLRGRSGLIHFLIQLAQL